MSPGVRRGVGWRPAFPLVAFALAMGAGIVAGQGSPPSLRVVFPDASSYLSGPVVLAAAVAPAGVATRVVFFADGRLTCTVQAPPYTCAWDAGPGVRAHQIRVVAHLVGGERLVQTVWTKAVAYAETVDVDSVQVTATVTDDDGKYVAGLKQDAFHVFEDDRRQKLTYFGAENTALEVIAAVDISGSMKDAIPKLKEAARAFLLALRPTDQVTLLGFNDNIFTLARSSVDPTSRAKAVDRLASWGGTALYDVVVRAVDMLGRQRGRRALVVFSDGEDTASHVPIRTAEDRLERSDVTVYTIAQGRATKVDRLQEILQRFAKKSGGRSFSKEKIEDLDKAFDEILEELSNQYLLAYEPTQLARDDAWHRIRVELNDRRFMVRARQGRWGAAAVKR
jgi:VWFA-related protein